MDSNFISEAKGHKYCKAFDIFISQPLLPASEMPLIEENELVKVCPDFVELIMQRLLFACSGIDSDLLLFDGMRFQFTVEHLRTTSMGPKALETYELGKNY